MRLIDADELKPDYYEECETEDDEYVYRYYSEEQIDNTPSIDIVRCEDCRKSHIDGKTTHYLWCTEWGRSTDTFGYCERGEREGE